MNVLRGIKHALTIESRGITVVYECRSCGASVDSESDTCPYCGPTDVARYEIE